tara:strand:+ start:3179 stop:3334 length:156 start_codon:yes stop_codon:yes gene_type:complete
VLLENTLGGLKHLTHPMMLAVFFRRHSSLSLAIATFETAAKKTNNRAEIFS